MDENPYESPQIASARVTNRNSIAPRIGISVSAIVATAFFFPIAGAATLNVPVSELSDANWIFSLVCGGFCGIPGAIIGTLMHATAKSNRFVAAIGCVLGWSFVASVGFFFYISIFMFG